MYARATHATLLSAFLGLVSAAPAAGSADSQPPNFVLILSDDQGWTGTSVAMLPGRTDCKSDYFQTPNLERLATEGMRFTRGYSPASLCCPTRRSIQFGQTPARIGDRRFAERYPVGNDRLTIPWLLKATDHRYRAAHFGKWDLRSQLLPEHLGYDESDGNTGNRDGNEHTNFSKTRKWSNHKTLEDPKKIFSVSDRAVEFMSRQSRSGNPFYLQVSHYAVHADQQTRPETLAKYQTLSKGERHRIPAYGGMTEDLDTGLGIVLDAIKELGIENHTYVFYMSDNGGVPWVPPNKRYNLANPTQVPEKSRNHPLRGGKWVLFEGGIRTPFIVRGPGVSAGSFCDVPVVGWDLLPTIADLAGYSQELPIDLDGGSFRSLLNNEGRGQVSRPAPALIFHRFSHRYSHSAVVRNRYKLVRFWQNPSTVTGSGEFQLFDLETDLGETKNLASEMPQKRDELNQLLTRYLSRVNAESPTQ